MSSLSSLFQHSAGIQVIILLLSAFFVGGIPSGYVIGRLWGVDVRRGGSRNIGATNVNRVAGTTPAVLTLILDTLKGVFATYIPAFMDSSGIPGADAVAGTVAIIGHCFSPFLLGQGGKGVATAMGVFFSLAPLAAFIGLVIFLVTLGFSRMVSLASLAGIWCAFLVIQSGKFGAYPAAVGTAALVTAALVTLRHNANIKRIRAGIEPRLG